MWPNLCKMGVPYFLKLQHNSPGVILQREVLKTNKNNHQFQPDLLFWRTVSVLCINASCWRTLALFGFFPERRSTLQFTFYCHFYLFFTANPLHSLSVVNWKTHEMTEGQVELFLKHWVFFSWYKTMRRRSHLRRGRWDSRRGGSLLTDRYCWLCQHILSAESPNLSSV